MSAAARVWRWGKRSPPTPPAPGAGVVSGPGTQPPPPANGKPPAKPPVQRPYQLVISVYAANLLNRNNRGIPIGNMASPYFLRSTSSSGSFFFGPGGGGSGGNRNVSLRGRLRF